MTSDLALDFGQGDYYSGYGNYCKGNYCRMDYCLDEFGYSSNHVEVYAVAYNVTNFRILWEILSDGTSGGSNVTATQVDSTSSADNIKSDSLEKYCLFVTKDVTITFNCEQSIYIDTIGILGHNLTAGATVTLLISTNGVNYSTLKVLPIHQSGETNTIICEASVLGPYQYWRLRIQDASNPDNLYVGRVVMGQSTVFDGENFTSRLSFRTQNYVEEESMNGFESAFRQRALRNILRLTFEDLSVSGGNYSEFRRYIRYCRNTLRALVIPDPTNPYRYSVWAKLKEMPTENHRSLDSDSTYATIECEWDEGR